MLMDWKTKSRCQYSYDQPKSQPMSTEELTGD